MQMRMLSVIVRKRQRRAPRRIRFQEFKGEPPQHTNRRATCRRINRVFNGQHDVFGDLLALATVILAQQIVPEFAGLARVNRTDQAVVVSRHNTALVVINFFFAATF